MYQVRVKVDLYLGSFLNFGLVGVGGQLYETAAFLPGERGTNVR